MPDNHLNKKHFYNTLQEDNLETKIKSMVSFWNKKAVEKITPALNIQTSKQEIETELEDTIETKAENIYKKFTDDITASSIRPTVGNVIQWLRRHKSISSDEIIYTAFKSIGIDVSTILKMKDTKKFNDTRVDNDISKEDISERTTRLFDLITIIGKRFGPNTNEFKKILYDTIQNNKSANDRFIVSTALKTYSGPINDVKKNLPVEEPKTPEEQKTIDKENIPAEDNSIKMYDKNGIRFKKGQIVRLILAPKTYDPINPNKKEERFGEITKIYFDNKTKNNVIRILVDDDEKGTYLFNVHEWNLLSKPNMITVFDAGDSVSETFDYNLEHKKAILSLKYNDYEPNLIIETLINFYLNESDDVFYDELTPFEIKGLFEILLYIRVAQKKGFDPSSVVPPFSSEHNINSYVERMYKRLYSIKKQYTSNNTSENEDIFNELYDAVLNRISNEFKTRLRTIVVNLIDKKNRYDIAIAFFTVLKTIMNDNNNKNVINKFINKMYSVSI